MDISSSLWLSVLLLWVSLGIGESTALSWRTLRSSFFGLSDTEGSTKTEASGKQGLAFGCISSLLHWVSSESGLEMGLKWESDWVNTGVPSGLCWIGAFPRSSLELSPFKAEINDLEKLAFVGSAVSIEESCPLNPFCKADPKPSNNSWRLVFFTITLTVGISVVATAWLLNRLSSRHIPVCFSWLSVSSWPPWMGSLASKPVASGMSNAARRSSKSGVFMSPMASQDQKPADYEEARFSTFALQAIATVVSLGFIINLCQLMIYF